MNNLLTNIYMMIKRMVKLTFIVGKSDDFKDLFYQTKHKILNMHGCVEVDLFQSNLHPSVFFTISTWQTESDLENYRMSELFRQTWTTIKPWFGDKPEAWTTQLVNPPF